MKRRTLSPEFKKKIAVEALREKQTINEIASKYQVHPVQVSKWKKELTDGALSIFEDIKSPYASKAIPGVFV